MVCGKLCKLKFFSLFGHQDQEPANQWHLQTFHKTVLDEFCRVAASGRIV